MKRIVCPVVYADAVWSLVRIQDNALIIIPFATKHQYHRRWNKTAYVHVVKGELRFSGDTKILTAKIKNCCRNYFVSVGLLKVNR